MCTQVALLLQSMMKTRLKPSATQVIFKFIPQEFRAFYDEIIQSTVDTSQSSEFNHIHVHFRTLLTNVKTRARYRLLLGMALQRVC